MPGGHADSCSDSDGIGLDQQIDEDLLSTAMKVTGHHSRRAVMGEVLRVLIQTKKQAGIRQLKGKIHFDTDHERRSSGSGGQELSLLKDARRGRSNAAKDRTAKLARVKKADRQLDRNLARLKGRLSLRRPFEEFDPDEVTKQARKTFGSAQKAHAWLNRPNRVLRGRTPLSLLANKGGMERVRTLLGRIEHGVYDLVRISQGATLFSPTPRLGVFALLLNYQHPA
jgi:putative toxin-antitoxin system antitoxin component (TIGR02293 family)